MNLDFTAARSSSIPQLDMSDFHLPSPSSASDDEDNLPYPKPLARADFLAPNFDANTFLSTLSQRHQTIEDLRADLRTRSQALSKELVDLVNANYETFLSLGADLKGGDVRVEDARMGLLGFRRGLEETRKQVADRRTEVERLLGEKRGVDVECELGRTMLEAHARLVDLEESLMIGSATEDMWNTDDSSDEDHPAQETAGSVGPSTRRLSRLARDLVVLQRVCREVGDEKPFIRGLQPRIAAVRKTLLLDLSNALRGANTTRPTDAHGVSELLDIFRRLDMGEDAVRILRDTRNGK